MEARRQAPVSDEMRRVNQTFDDRNIRHAIQLILDSPNAEEIVKELNWRLKQRR